MKMICIYAIETYIYILHSLNFRLAHIVVGIIKIIVNLIKYFTFKPILIKSFNIAPVIMIYANQMERLF